MSLKKLNIYFQNRKNFFNDIDNAIKEDKILVDSFDTINFDTIDTYRSFMTSNKINILTAISKLRPLSVYEVATHLNRKPQHVLADCRSLESCGFIKLIPETTGRRPLRPTLTFDYDVIMIEGNAAMPLAISEKALKLLADNCA